MTKKPDFIVEDARVAQPVASPDTVLAASVSSAGSAGSRGRGPSLVSMLVCLASALCGVVIDRLVLQTPPPAPRVALVEQGAIVLDALLNRPELDAPTARRVVGGTVAAVVAKYQQAGYLVINVNPSQDGEMVVEAIPKSAVDITEEMRAAVARAVSSAAANTAPNHTPAESAPSARPSN